MVLRCKVCGWIKSNDPTDFFTRCVRDSEGAPVYAAKCYFVGYERFRASYEEAVRICKAGEPFRGISMAVAGKEFARRIKAIPWAARAQPTSYPPPKQGAGAEGPK